MSNDNADQVTFDGSNWQDLSRLVTNSRMKFLQTDSLDDNPYEGAPAQCAYLVAKFRGPALDWAGMEYDANNQVFNNFTNFVTSVRNAFGISDEGLSAQRRAELEGLKWDAADLPVFFAEFDRITRQLSLNDNATKIALVRSKLPLSVQKLLSEQALNFADYATMRERLLTMWNLDPGRQTAVTTSTRKKKPRCGRCGKKGHTASDCRAKN